VVLRFDAGRLVVRRLGRGLAQALHLQGLLAQQRALQVLDALELPGQLFAQRLAAAQVGDAGLQGGQVFAQAGHQGVPTDQGGPGQHQLGLRPFELLRLLAGLPRAALLRTGQLIGQHPVLVQQGVQAGQVGPVGRAGLVLQQMDVLQHALLQQRIAARVRQRGPQRARHAVALALLLPPPGQGLGGLDLLALAHGQQVAPVQLLLHGLGHGAALPAVAVHPAVQFVVRGQGLAAQHLVGQTAHHRQGQAHADHRAMGMLAQLPDAPAPRAPALGDEQRCRVAAGIVVRQGGADRSRLKQVHVGLLRRRSARAGGRLAVCVKRDGR
jgi:hypothetical protein